MILLSCILEDNLNSRTFLMLTLLEMKHLRYWEFRKEGFSSGVEAMATGPIDAIFAKRKVVIQLKE